MYVFLLFKQARNSSLHKQHNRDKGYDFMRNKIVIEELNTLLRGTLVEDMSNN